MSTEAEEVAEDYRLALEDLNANMRFEISNLTVIARENTEHALVIAEVLEKHILKTAPTKKLPALYVLDSIVKNVGTPYTLYLGRNLFKIFMEAYTVVDNATRKRMEEMLKTWKQPVAGSMDTRPVFSPDLVRPIENALMKAKAAMMPQMQMQGHLPGRPRSSIPPHRDTPTPPGMRSASGTPGNSGQPLNPYMNGSQPSGNPYHGQYGHPHSNHVTPQPSVTPFQAPIPNTYGSFTAPPPGNAIDTLNSDIHNLITAVRASVSQNPQDAGLQTRLGALLDLQRIVQSTSLPPDQLELIRKQVTDLASVTLRAPSAVASAPAVVPKPTPPPAFMPAHIPTSSTSTVAPMSAPPPAPTATPPSISLDSLLGSGAMAALMARQASQNSTPQPPVSTTPVYANAAIRSPQPAPSEPYRASQPPPQQLSQLLAQSQKPSSASSLLDQLRAAGLLPAATPAQTTPMAPAPPPLSTTTIPPNIASLLSSGALASALAAVKKPSSSLTSASLKLPCRPEAIMGLFDNLGAPCTQCGRRFQADAEGRRQKMAHMDWHFRVHQRSGEAAKRGTHRSWYVDQQDWLKSREVTDADHAVSSLDDGAGGSSLKHGAGGSDENGGSGADTDRPKYIPVPDPARGVNNVCPICQDRFENKWLDTAQEWVWLDCVLVGGRAYHASCHAEATRDREGTPRPTPEPVLGKRKAEMGLASPKVRSLKTSA